MTPSSSSRIAGTTISRGCGRVPSQTLIATVCPARTTIAQRWPGHRTPERLDDRPVLVDGWPLMGRADDRRASGRNLEHNPSVAVGELNVHGGIARLEGSPRFDGSSLPVELSHQDSATRINGV